MFRRGVKHFVDRAFAPARPNRSEEKAKADDDTLRKSEGWLRMRAAALEAEGKRLLDEAAKFRQLADALKASEPRGLSKTPKTRSLIGMESTLEPRGRGRPPKYSHPFRTRLRERGSNPKRWAEAHDVSYSTVKSWYAPPDSKAARAIPRRYAELIERELDLPATSATWKNNITD